MWNRGLQKEILKTKKKSGVSGEAVEKMLASEPSRFESLVLREQIRETEVRIKGMAGKGLSESYLANEDDYAD
jgi:hypothetical protein